MVIKLAEACVAPTHPNTYVLNTVQSIAHAESHKHIHLLVFFSLVTSKTQLLSIGDHTTLFKSVSSDCRLNKQTTHTTQINNAEEKKSPETNLHPVQLHESCSNCIHVFVQVA